MTVTTPRANADRLWQAHMDMARIGATPGGGVGRIALTDLDRQARDLFVSWAEAAGCTVSVDRLGNVIARRPGRDPDRAPVMTGSHLDTQPLGGRFDGIYGVLAGLEAVRALNDAGVETEAPVDVAVWTDEEGVRFASGAVASAVFAGTKDADEALALTDADGVTMATALAEIGYAGDTDCGYPVDSFFEAHIEQGPVLESEGLTVGVVQGAQAQRCFEVTVSGEEGHAGTLPMRLRRDAMTGAARMIDAVVDLAYDYEPNPVITVGHVRVRPNSRNTIPGEVVFTIDSRHPDNDVLAAVDGRIQGACEAIAAETRTGVDVQLVSEREAVVFDETCAALIRGAARALGIPHMDIYSGAGHDACNLVAHAPTAMLFVPCKDGISHNERESAEPEDLARGCDVLIAALLARAGVAA